MSMKEPALFKHMLTVGTAVLSLAACGDVEAWLMRSFASDGTELASQYTTSEQRCRKHGEVALSTTLAIGTPVR
jgi:hypothetical protein